MTTKDKIFDKICTLSDEAEAAGLKDVSLVLEFALDVYLKESARAEASKASDTDTNTAKNGSAPAVLEQTARRIEALSPSDMQQAPSLGWSMSTFPLANVRQPERSNARKARELVKRRATS